MSPLGVVSGEEYPSAGSFLSCVRVTRARFHIHSRDFPAALADAGDDNVVVVVVVVIEVRIKRVSHHQCT